MHRDKVKVWHRSYDPDVPTTVDYPDECLPTLVERRAREYSNNKATWFFGASMTYGTLWTQMQSFAVALSRLGVGKGTRVAVMLPNCPQAIISYYAVLWLGGIVVLTNPMYVEREMEHQWNDSGAEILIVLDHLYPKVERVLPKTAIRTVIVTSMREYLPFFLKLLYPLKARKDKLFTAVPYGDRVRNFSRLIKQAPPTPPPFSASLDDVALLQYTGGTTGVAKGVMLTHRNIMSNVMQILSWVPYLKVGEERMVAVLPFFHVFGMTIAMNLALCVASTIIMSPRFEVKSFLNILRKTKPTIFPGVPTIYVAIVNYPDVRSYDLSSIHLCVTGSSAMPLEVLRKFEEITGGAIIEGYGLTESSPVTHVNPLRGVRKPGSIGVALPDTDYKIVDLETGSRELPPGEEGELLVRGPQVMLGYWNRPDETETALEGDWLHTGDIARMDEDGYIYIVDRKKDMIIAGGFNIYPREIDEVLYEHPAIADAVAVGVPHPYRGETVKAFVVKKPGAALTEEDVVKFCRSKLAAYKVPKSVEFRDSLPKTLVGKILRKELRAQELSKQKQEAPK